MPPVISLAGLAEGIRSVIVEADHNLLRRVVRNLEAVVERHCRIRRIARHSQPSCGVVATRCPDRIDKDLVPVKATIVDASGKSMDVDAILGADELYDVAKFRVLGNTTAANIATAESPAGSKVWLVPYSIKKPAYQQEDISSVEKFKATYNYYIFSNSAPENAVGRSEEHT